MSSTMTAPESEQMPSQQVEREEWQPTGHLWSPQVACAVLLVLSDILAIVTSLEAAVLLRKYVLPQVNSHYFQPTFSFWGHTRAFGWMWLVLLLFLAVEGMYTQRRSVWNEIGHLVKAIGLGVVAILSAAALAQLSPGVSRATILLTAMNLVFLLPVVRFWSKWAMRKTGLWRKRILIMGAGESARLAIQGLNSDPVLGYEVAGLLDNDPHKKGKCIGMCGGNHAYILGDLSEVREQMLKTQSKDVLVALSGLPEIELVTIVQKLQTFCECVYVVPHVAGLPMMHLQVDGFLRERVMLFKLSNNLAKPWNSWFKRIMDLVLGGIFSLLALPLGLIIAILIKMDSKGSALFVQERLGYQGRNFHCIKFRTMHLNGDEKLDRYLKNNPSAAEEWHHYAKLREFDPRITKVGQFLRRWSLDELPQLVNVLKGDMSLVGPRPYLPQERTRMGVSLSTILSSRPGVTGFWQVNGRNHVTFDERVHLEAWYVRNWTVWLDCIVLAKTVKAVGFPQNGKATPDEKSCGALGSVRSFKAG